jgi:hypothetical protein
MELITMLTHDIRLALGRYRFAQRSLRELRESPLKRLIQGDDDWNDMVRSSRDNMIHFFETVELPEALTELLEQFRKFKTAS